MRARILERLLEEPGIAFVALHQRLRADPRLARGVGFGALLHHLGILERHGRIAARKSGRYRRYYRVDGVLEGTPDEFAVLQTPTGGATARALLDLPQANQSALWSHVRERRLVTRQAVAYYLRKLEACGLSESLRCGGRRTYRPTPRLLRLQGLVPAGRPRVSETVPGPLAVTA